MTVRQSEGGSDVLPGAHRRYGNYVSDGYMVLILIVHESDPGPCPGARDSLT